MAVWVEPASPPFSPSRLHSSAADNFSLTGGDLIPWLQARFGHSSHPVRVSRRALLAVLVTWLPLLVLSAAQGLAYGGQTHIPFLRDIAVNVRFLIGLPLLILCEIEIDQRLRVAVKQFLETELIKEPDLPSFENVIESLTRLRDRLLPKVVMIVLAFLPALYTPTMEVMMTTVPSWHFVTPSSGAALSEAGWWFGLVSMPVYHYLLLRWLWRMLLWAIFLWRVSRLNLALVPTHPDRAAGIGFVSSAPVGFSTIAFAGGVVIAGRCGNALAYEGATVSSLKFVMITYCLLSVAILVAPLLVLGPMLFRAKKQGRREYGALASGYTHMFDAKWVHGRPPQGEGLLGSPDIQSLADLNNSFATVQAMRLIPISKQTLIALALSAALPLVPVLILGTPADQLIRTALKFLT
jgi:hypothetical protein